MANNVSRPDPECCAICFDDFDENSVLSRVDDCRHIFDQACLQTWMAQRNSCPLCRSQITSINGVSTQIVPAQIPENDFNLLRFFNYLAAVIPQDHLPLLNDSASIRAWMTENPNNILDQFTYVDLSNSGLTSLPLEIMLLNNLERLVLENNPIASLPDNLNLPNLRSLYLSNTQIASLPDHLNLPQLGWLSLSNTLIASLPDDLNLPQLWNLNLSNTPIASLPDHLNLPQLLALDLSNTPIASFPDLLNLPQLVNLDLSNTPIALPNWILRGRLTANLIRNNAFLMTAVWISLGVLLARLYLYL